MKTDIRFRHMERSESLEEFVHAKIERALEHCLHRHDAHLQVWLISERNLVNRGTGWFICEISVRYPPRKDLFVRKESDDMRLAVQDAVNAVQTLIDEEGKKEAHLRSKHTPPAADVPSESE